MSNVKVISERNLDENTITKSEDGKKIQVKVSQDESNLIKVTEQGLTVQAPKTVKLNSLGGQEIGELIINE